MYTQPKWNFTLLFLILGICNIGCGKEIRRPLQTGVFLNEIEQDGVPCYQIVSVGKASEAAIQKGSIPMKQNSACDSARMMARQKIQELTGNPRATERLAESKGIRIFEEGTYCEVTYLLPKE